VAGDAAQLHAVADELGLAVLDGVRVLDTGPAGVAAGEVGAASGQAAIAAVRLALDAIAAGEACALVTGPIAKRALRAAGHDWVGQTEMLADLVGGGPLRVLLTGGPLTVVHVSAHRSLASAVAAVTREAVLHTISLAHEHGRALGLSAPRIGVAGLNPHAGEGGLLGDEDAREITPAIADAIAAGIRAEGPISADALFPRAAAGDVDVVVAMYHDQGHIPVKLIAPAAVAMSLGLAIVRTSPDHGAAPDIAASRSADPASMVEAILLAQRLGRA
jgi:4-hydroxythreonine-4-phosphate dehydrogenase